MLPKNISFCNILLILCPEPTNGAACDCKSARLWVCLTFDEIKYLILSFLCSLIEAKIVEFYFTTTTKHLLSKNLTSYLNISENKIQKALKSTHFKRLVLTKATSMLNIKQTSQTALCTKWPDASPSD